MQSQTVLFEKSISHQLTVPVFILLLCICTEFKFKIFFLPLFQGQNHSNGGGGGGQGGDEKKDKKKKYEPPVPTRVGKKKKRMKGPDAANKLPLG